MAVVVRRRRSWDRWWWWWRGFERGGCYCFAVYIERQAARPFAMPSCGCIPA